jgi:hypothetical protein
MRKIFICTAVASLGLFAVSCNNNNNNNENMNNNNSDTTTMSNSNYNNNDNSANEAYNQRVTAYHERSKARLDSLRTVLAHEDTVNTNAGAKAKADWQKAKAKINNQIDSLQADIDRSSSKSEADWDKFQNKVDREFDTLQTNWDAWKNKHLKKQSAK